MISYTKHNTLTVNQVQQKHASETVNYANRQQSAMNTQRKSKKWIIASSSVVAHTHSLLREIVTNLLSAR